MPNFSMLYLLAHMQMQQLVELMEDFVLDIREKSEYHHISFLNNDLQLFGFVLDILIPEVHFQIWIQFQNLLYRLQCIMFFVYFSTRWPYTALWNFEDVHVKMPTNYTTVKSWILFVFNAEMCMFQQKGVYLIQICEAINKSAQVIY